jgi:hypothetical protein
MRRTAHAARWWVLGVGFVGVLVGVFSAVELGDVIDAVTHPESVQR